MKSKNSYGEEEKRSVGVSDRNNSQHNTNRSNKASVISSKNQLRHSIAYQGSSDMTNKNMSMSQVSTKNVLRKSECDTMMKDSSSKSKELITKETEQTIVQKPSIL